MLRKPVVRFQQKAKKALFVEKGEGQEIEDGFKASSVRWFESGFDSRECTLKTEQCDKKDKQGNREARSLDRKSKMWNFFRVNTILKTNFFVICLHNS